MIIRKLPSESGKKKKIQIATLSLLIHNDDKYIQLIDHISKSGKELGR